MGGSQISVGVLKLMNREGDANNFRGSKYSQKLH